MHITSLDGQAATPKHTTYILESAVDLFTCADNPVRVDVAVEAKESFEEDNKAKERPDTSCALGNELSPRPRFGAPCKLRPLWHGGTIQREWSEVIVLREWGKDSCVVCVGRVYGLNVMLTGGVVAVVDIERRRFRLMTLAVDRFSGIPMFGDERK